MDSENLFEKMNPEDMQFVLQLIQRASIDHISEISYKSVRVRFHTVTNAAGDKNSTKRVEWNTLHPGIK